jgi:hypothetical protein
MMDLITGAAIGTVISFVTNRARGLRLADAIGTRDAEWRAQLAGNPQGYSECVAALSNSVCLHGNNCEKCSKIKKLATVVAGKATPTERELIRKLFPPEDCDSSAETDFYEASLLLSGSTGDPADYILAVAQR